MTNRTVSAALPSRAARWRKPALGKATPGVLGQSVLFSGATALVSILAMGCSVLAARSLTTAEFGSFSFAKSLLLFLAVVFELGVSNAAGRMLAQVDGVEQRRLLGATLYVLAPIALLFSLVVLAFSTFVDSVFHVDIALALAAVAPLSFAYPARQQWSLLLSRGVGRLHVYSWTLLIGQALFLAVLALAVVLGAANSVPMVLLLQTAAFAVAAVVAIVWLRPILRGVRAYVPTLLAESRRWGSQVYVGRMLSYGTYNMDVLMLGAFASASAVGFYSLAGSFGSVVSLPVTGVMSALFPQMVRERAIPRRWFAFAYAIGGLAVVTVWFAAGPFITFVFSDAYAEAASLAFPLTIAGAVNGISVVYSSFFSAQAKGREMRNGGFVGAGSNVVLNLALIPPFGAMGAAWASVLALVVKVAYYDVLYRRILRLGPVAT